MKKKLEARSWKLGWAGALAISYLLSPISSWAELTATVYPGYTLSANERPTTAILNLLARPTVTVSGTLGGTNVGLAANSVSGAMLMTSVADDSTVQFFDNGGVTALRVKASGINTNQISTAIAGDGLGGGGGYPLSNKVDNVYLRITNDVVALWTNIPVNYLNVSNAQVVVGNSAQAGSLQTLPVFYSNTVAAVTYTSSTVALSTVTTGGTQINSAHSLGVTPKFVRGILVNTTAEFGYSPGDEVEFADIYGPTTIKPLVVGGNSTNVFAVVNGDPSISWQIRSRVDGTFQNITDTSWSMRIYARP